MKKKLMLSVVLAGGLFVGQSAKAAIDFEGIWEYAESFEDKVYSPLKTMAFGINDKYTALRNNALKLKNKASESTKKEKAGYLLSMLSESFDMFNLMAGLLLGFIDVPYQALGLLDLNDAQRKVGDVKDKINDVKEYSVKIQGYVARLANLIGAELSN